MKRKEILFHAAKIHAGGWVCSELGKKMLVIKKWMKNEIALLCGGERELLHILHNIFFPSFCASNIPPTECTRGRKIMNNNDER